MQNKELSWECRYDRLRSEPDLAHIGPVVFGRRDIVVASSGDGNLHDWKLAIVLSGLKIGFGVTLVWPS